MNAFFAMICPVPVLIYLRKFESIVVYSQKKANIVSLSRDLNTGPADYKSAALPTKPLRRHSILTFDGKKDGDEIHFWLFFYVQSQTPYTHKN
jgi:hypothetical protein